MSGTFNAKGELEPSAAAIILCVGKKGSGKTVMVLLIASAWPYDMVVVDVAGDDGPLARKPGSGSHDVVEITGPVDELPRQWPEHLRREKRPMILRYVPDPGSPTELEDMDAMVGLAYSHSSTERPCMLVIHEIGRAAPAGRTPPHMRRVLNHSRHRGLTGAFAGPRPQTVDPLIVAQATILFGYAMVDLAAISFLGLGVQPPEPNWGVMISENQVGIPQGYPLPALVACACIVVVVIAVNVLGERLFEQAQRTHR